MNSHRPGMPGSHCLRLKTLFQSQGLIPAGRQPAFPRRFQLPLLIISPQISGLHLDNVTNSGRLWGWQGHGDGAGTPSTCREWRPRVLSTEFPEKLKMLSLTLIASSTGHKRVTGHCRAGWWASTSESRDLVSRRPSAQGGLKWPHWLLSGMLRTR